MLKSFKHRFIVTESLHTESPEKIISCKMRVPLRVGLWFVTWYRRIWRSTRHVLFDRSASSPVLAASISSSAALVVIFLWLLSFFCLPECWRSTTATLTPSLPNSPDASSTRSKVTGKTCQSDGLWPNLNPCDMPIRRQLPLWPFWQSRVKLMRLHSFRVRMPDRTQSRIQEGSGLGSVNWPHGRILITELTARCRSNEAYLTKSGSIYATSLWMSHQGGGGGTRRIVHSYIWMHRNATAVLQVL